MRECINQRKDNFEDDYDYIMSIMYSKGKPNLFPKIMKKKRKGKKKRNASLTREE